MGVMLMDYDSTKPDIKYPCDVNRARSLSTRQWAEEVVRRVRARKETPAVTPAPRELVSDNVRTLPPPDPKLMTDDERGEGDSTNARWHRLLNPRKFPNPR